MNAYDPTQVPVITTLAQEFKLMNRWFAAVPGPTDPNKMFLHAASSQGNTEPCFFSFCDGYPMTIPTIFDHLDKEGITNKIHYMDWNEALAIFPLYKNTSKFLMDDDF